MSVRKLLRKDKFLVYDYDNVEQSGLHWAAKRAHLHVVKELIENGAYIDIYDIGKRTPLFLAAKCNHFEVVKYLLEQNANPYFQTHQKQHSIEVAATPALKNYMRTVALKKMKLFLKEEKTSPDHESTESSKSRE